jgi:hypothetical protein
VADVHLDGDDVVIELTGLEKAESLHGDVRVPRSSVRAVAAVDDPVGQVKGLKIVGARVTGHFAIGTFTGNGARTFAVVHHGVDRGVRLDLQGAAFDLVLVSCEDPDSVVASLGDPTG